jgi:hypothetical protein
MVENKKLYIEKIKIERDKGTSYTVCYDWLLEQGIAPGTAVKWANKVFSEKTNPIELLPTSQKKAALMSLDTTQADTLELLDSNNRLQLWNYITNDLIELYKNTNNFTVGQAIQIGEQTRIITFQDVSTLATAKINLAAEIESRLGLQRKADDIQAAVDASKVDIDFENIKV